MKRNLFGIAKAIGLAAMLLCALPGYSQVNTYVYSTTTGNVLETGGFTNLIGIDQDDAASVLTNIGFTFNFGGINYTQFGVTSNGLMELGAVPITTFTNNLSTLTGPYISPNWDDQYTADNGNVQYKLMGSSPNQKLVVEWNVVNCCTNTFDKTYQVWLFEGTNTIMFVYGAGTSPTSSTISISTNGNTDFYSVTSSANTASTVTANNSNGTWPGSGRAYVFTPPPFDVMAQALATPLATGCYTNSETVAMTVRNNGSTPLDFTVNNTTVSIQVTGAVTQNYTTTLTDNSLNGGVPMNPGSTITVPLGTLNMTTAGTYTFNGSISASDPAPANDAMPVTTRTVSGGTTNVSSSNICFGDSVALSLTGTAGTVQWQDSLSGGSWNNIPGGTTNPFTHTPSDTISYRAFVCGTLYSSNIVTVNVNVVGNPTATGATRCGTGPVTVTATGSASIRWYDQVTGGNLLAANDSLTTNVWSDTTFYVENSSGTPPTAYLTTLAAGNGFNANMFGITALNTISITQFDGHTSSTGSTSWDVYYRPNDYLLTPGANTSSAGWILLGSAAGVTGMGVGVATPIPVTFSVTIPAGQTYSFYVAETSGAGVEYTNGTMLGAVYNQNSDLQFRQGHGGDLFSCTNQPRVFNGNIYYSSGCASPRLPVSVTVTPAAAINLTASTTHICDVDTITLSVTSANASYQYTYSPGTDLSATTGSSVMAWPQNSTTYVVNAIDTANCLNSDTLSITVSTSPTGSLTLSDSVICAGDTVTLHLNSALGGTFTTTTPVNIPDDDLVGVYSGINVSGISSSLMSGNLVSVCLDITHTFDGDLEIRLMSPLGTLYDLSLNNGSGGDNYTSTCFDMTALTLVSSGASPFTGDYYPDGFGGFDSFNGEDGNGLWQLWIVDDAGGDVGTLNNWSITFGGISPQYSWASIPAGLSDTNAIVVVTPAITTTYIGTVTNLGNGCSRSFVDSVTVNQLPIVNLGPDTAICSNYAGITLDGTTLNSSTYTWQDNQSGATYFVSLPGQYSLTVVDIHGCVGADTVNVGTINASVVSIDANLITIHSANLDAGPGFISYHWSTTATTEVITVNTNGTYYVQAVDQHGCMSTDTLTIIFTLGVEPNGSESLLQLYPNPSQGVFNLSISNLEANDMVIDIMDMKGSIVYNHYVGSVSGSAIIPFSLQELRQGAYTMRITANGVTKNIRFVISE